MKYRVNSSVILRHFQFCSIATRGHVQDFDRTNVFGMQLLDTMQESEIFAWIKVQDHLAGRCEELGSEHPRTFSGDLGLLKGGVALELEFHRDQ